MKITLSFLLFFAALNLVAQAPPATPPPGTPKTIKVPVPAGDHNPEVKALQQAAFSDDARKNIIIDYQTALLAQHSAQSAQQFAQTAVQAFVTTCQRETKTAGLPEGTQCQVDVNAKTVTPVPPASVPPTPPNAKAPETKPAQTVPKT